MVINSYLLQTVLNVVLLILHMWNYLSGERLSLFYFFSAVLLCIVHDILLCGCVHLLVSASCV